MVSTLLRRIVNGFEKPWSKGTVIDDYKIVDLVGKGSYGTTYSLEHTITGQEAILKRIRPYKRIFSDPVQYVKNEFITLQILSHSQFPNVYCYGEYNKTPYFIMEKMKGRTFEDLIFREGKTYSERESLMLGLQLVNLLNSIHDKGYIHRDLRIPNILLDDSTLYVIDFGLSCEISSTNQPKLTQHKELMREKSVKSDFYALGHFLLFLLYSAYEPTTKKERSWEEELMLKEETRQFLRRLLQIDVPFLNSREVRQELLRMLRTED
ncbi:serine/threonine protein kinase [Rossellomorea aquimaris]|uniref:serine/threonine protein kinase n=1 Tax=Rossellomorea aquimaris TaxID=189382 RepID=UPI0007D08206|nr:protein kinase family protein [Rossellomorea aquimaris]